MTPAQCRAARGLLDLTQADLGEAAHVGYSTIEAFEKSRTKVASEKIDAIRTALETAGVIFIEVSDGQGVQLRKAAQPKA